MWILRDVFVVDVCLHTLLIELLILCSTTISVYILLHVPTVKPLSAALKSSGD